MYCAVTFGCRKRIDLQCRVTIGIVPNPNHSARKRSYKTGLFGVSLWKMKWIPYKSKGLRKIHESINTFCFTLEKPTKAGFKTVVSLQIGTDCTMVPVFHFFVLNCLFIAAVPFFSMSISPSIPGSIPFITGLYHVMVIWCSGRVDLIPLCLFILSTQNPVLFLFYPRRLK